LNGPENLVEHFNDTHRLDQDLFQFSEDGARSMCLVVDSISVLMPLKKSRLSERSEIALNVRWSNAQISSKFSEIPPLLGLKNRGSQ